MMPKRLIIAGSRDLDERKVLDILSRDLKPAHISEVVSGGARGADAAGERWARSRGIPVRQFPADWDRYGRSAGPRRNEEMAQYGEALFVVWDGKSPGTADMIRRAKARGLPMKVVRV